MPVYALIVPLNYDVVLRSYDVVVQNDEFVPQRYGVVVRSYDNGFLKKDFSRQIPVHQYWLTMVNE